VRSVWTRAKVADSLSSRDVSRTAELSSAKCHVEEFHYKYDSTFQFWLKSNKITDTSRVKTEASNLYSGGSLFESRPGHGYHEGGFSWFYLVPPGKCRDCLEIGHGLFLIHSFQLFNYLIIFLLPFFPVAPTWSVGHPWNASFHFSFLNLIDIR
jgi:hypothetical protein